MTDDNWFPTAELRFVEKLGGYIAASNGDGMMLFPSERVLQQKWRVYPADASITRDEWRDVPMVTEK